MNFKEKWKKMGKGAKVGTIAALAGATIASIPFIIAAGPMSIVSALALLGGGTLAAGGFGVAGGIIVTVGGAALSSGLAAFIANNAIKDPELKELQENFARIEELAAKIQLMSEDSLSKYKMLRKEYVKLAEFVANMLKVKEKKKHDKDQLRKHLYASRDLIKGLEKAG